MTLFVLADGLQGEYADDIIKELTEIYDLICSAVTNKDGTVANDWHQPFSECIVAISKQTILEIASKINAFNEKTDALSEFYSDDERIVAQNINDFHVERALDGLVCSMP
jgi:hypothetical protein